MNVNLDLLKRYSADIDAITASVVLSREEAGHTPAELDCAMIEYAQAAAEWAPLDAQSLRILEMDPRTWLDAIQNGHEDDGEAVLAPEALREDADFAESWLCDTGRFMVSNDGGLTIYDATALEPRQRRIIAEGECYDPEVDAPESDADYASEDENAPAIASGLAAVVRIDPATEGYAELARLVSRTDAAGAVEFTAELPDGKRRTVRIIVGTECGGK